MSIFAYFSRSYSTILIKPLIVVGSLVGIVSLQSLELTPLDKSLTVKDYQKQVEEERSALKIFRRTPSLGFSNVIADWLYLQFIQYFGDNLARDQSGYVLSGDYFEQIVERDPNFNDAISKLDVAESLFAGNPQKSVNLLEKSLEKQPAKFQTSIPSYYLWRAKGNNELLFLGDPSAAIRSYRQSILSAKAYDDEESRRIMGISEKSIKFLETNPESKFARIGAWVSILSNRPDPKTVRRVVEAIEALGGTVTFSSDGTTKVQLPKNAN